MTLKALRWIGVATLCLVAPASPTESSRTPVGDADLILKNGAIYTVDPAQPWAEAVAIQGDTIVFVGTDVAVDAFEGPGTEVIDLEGRMAMPGIHDPHNHLLEVFHASWSCGLPFGLRPEDYIPFLSQCNAVGGDWVIGYGYEIERMVQHLRAGGRPPVEILDEAIPDHPAALIESNSHSVWANSLALAAAGFDADSDDPPGGVILRTPGTGEPNGILLDGAGEVVMDLAFELTPTMEDLNEAAVIRGLDRLRRQGVTSFVDGRTYWRRGYDAAYRKVEQDGGMTARVMLGLWAYPYLGDADQLATLASMYDDDPSSRVRAAQIKIYSDGEVGHTTAALLEPYVRLKLAGQRGLTYFDAGRLRNYVTRLERVGFDFFIHAIGDRGARQALDAVEAARGRNGDLGRRHRLTHLEVLAPDDIPRFAALDVIADVQTSSDFVLPENLSFYWAFLGQTRTEERVLRLRDLHESGARVVLSSDFDVGDLSPFSGMERAIDRGDQSLPDLAAAIRAYTIDGAYLMRQEDRLGTLEAGKLADVIVLDRNLFDIPTAELSDALVTLTFVGGEEVWRRPGF